MSCKLILNGISGAKIDNCMNFGYVHAIQTSSGNAFYANTTVSAGGIVGLVTGPATIEYCCSEGTVLSDAQSYLVWFIRVGGILGYKEDDKNHSVVNNSWANSDNVNVRYCSTRGEDPKTFNKSQLSTDTSVLNLTNSGIYQTDYVSDDRLINNNWPADKWNMGEGINYIPLDVKWVKDFEVKDSIVTAHVGVSEVLVINVKVLLNTNDTYVAPITVFKSDINATNLNLNYGGVEKNIVFTCLNPIGIEISRPSSCPIYVVGSDVNSTDAIVSAKYDDDRSIALASSEYAVSGTSSSKGAAPIKITYLGFDITYTGYFKQYNEWGILAYPENGSFEPQFYTTVKGESIAISAPSNGDKEFDGWKYYSESGVERGFSESFTPTGDSIVYAKWSNPSNSNYVLIGGAVAVIAIIILIVVKFR